MPMQHAKNCFMVIEYGCPYLKKQGCLILTVRARQLATGCVSDSFGRAFQNTKGCMCNWNHLIELITTLFK